MNEDPSKQPPHECPQCGAELPANVPPEACPKCLLRAGLTTTADSPGCAATASTATARDLPQPGECLGRYEIKRLLGKGGMGAVFEAFDHESGRPVALKVLSHSLDAPEARSRFLREGRLAASLNHPNSVYVFGTDEIAGTPVIAMELVSGGTLHERVREKGPLNPAAAVDAILQVIAGLAAAQKVGILHRDVKPSNCFVAPDGTVKIGDFGLSISSSVRIEPGITAQGAFLGTPAFCSPEQLRGEELSVRSDVYSVGATLYYLLTGRTPFESKNVVQLLATVLEQRPKPPGQLRPGIPAALGKIVLRCLAKDAGQRFKDYAELSRALAPYSSVAPRPATLGLRILAGLADFFILGAAGNLALLIWLGSPLKILEVTVTFSPRTMLLMAFAYSLGILYFAVPEALWGATPGKALLRLRVTRHDRTAPGWGQAFARALLFILVLASPYWLLVAWQGSTTIDYSSKLATFSGFVVYILLGALFLTARSRNGFAAVHDLLTGTRVIARIGLLARPALPETDAPPQAVGSQPRLGPYHVLQPLDSEWLLGYDLQLLRKVWIRQVPEGTPPVPASLRSLGRIGRLRWLNSRRAPGENWDAFEALGGEPLVRLAQTPQPWKHVRFWLDDLAQELEAAAQDGTLPDELRLDRIWITSEGRAKLLDVLAPGLASDNAATPMLVLPRDNPAQFLTLVANAALSGSLAPVIQAPARPLSLSARRFLEALPTKSRAIDAREALRPLLHRPAEVSHLRRAAVVAGCALLPLLACFGSMFGAVMFKKMQESQPGVFELNMLLQQRLSLQRWAPASQSPDEELVGVFVASRYSSVITNQAVWQGPLATAFIQGESRRFAEVSVQRYADASPEKVAAAENTLKGFVPNMDPFDLAKSPWVPVLVFSVSVAAYVGLPAIIAALLFRGGLVLLATGITFVNRAGQRASRLRVSLRALLGWGGFLGLGLALFLAGHETLGILPAAMLAWTLLAGLVALSLLLPERGLSDRLAGTWPVPR